MRTRVRLKLDDKILSNDIGELDDLFAVNMTTDVVEQSTKEVLDVELENGDLGSSAKASAVGGNEAEKTTNSKGMNCPVLTVVIVLVIKQYFNRVVAKFRARFIHRCHLNKLT